MLPQVWDLYTEQSTRRFFGRGATHQGQHPTLVRTYSQWATISNLPGNSVVVSEKSYVALERKRGLANYQKTWALEKQVLRICRHEETRLDST